MAVLLRLKRTHHTLTNSSLLHYRLFSTSNSRSDGPSSSSFHSNSKQASLNFKFMSDEPFENKWKQLTVSLLSLRDRYTIDGRLLSEMINSRQAFLNDKINHLLVLSALPSYPTVLPPQTMARENSREKLMNLNSLDSLMKLKDILVKEDELSAKLTNSRLACLQVIIMNLSSAIYVPPRRWDKLNERRSKLNQRLLRLRVKEVRLDTFTLLLHMQKYLRETIFKVNILMSFKEMRLVKKDELIKELIKSRLTRREFKEIYNNFLENNYRSVPPKDWKLNEMWNELSKRHMRIMRLREMEVESDNNDSTSKKILNGRRNTFFWSMRLKKMLVEKDRELAMSRRETSFVESLGEEVKTLNRQLRLKEMLVKEDDVSLELTNSRLTSLQEIINNFSEITKMYVAHA